MLRKIAEIDSRQNHTPESLPLVLGVSAATAAAAMLAVFGIAIL